MEFVDTHTHLYDEAYGGVEGQDDAVRRAIAAGVTMMIVPDTGPAEREPLLALCERWKTNTRPCIGLHPEEVDAEWRAILDGTLATARALSQRIAAIGEVGMDLHWSKEFEKQQEEAFRAQLDIALELGLPVIIHSRDATLQTFDILEDYRGKGLRGVFHAFSGSFETFSRLERYGDWYVGIGGVLTFKKASIAETAVRIPLERMLLETDSPYLTPVPHRGERNESAYIPLIGGFLASVKGTSIEEVAAVTSGNAKKLFRL